MKQVQEAIKELDAETTALSVRLETYVARWEAGDATAAAGIRAVGARLKVLGNDPNNPVPENPTLPA